MNNYYANQNFPSTPLYVGSNNITQEQPNIQNFFDNKNFNIFDLLSLNKGKKVNVHMSFNNSSDDKVFSGIIEYCSKDYLIISNPKNGEWNLLLMMYLDYIVFEEKINY